MFESLIISNSTPFVFLKNHSPRVTLAPDGTVTSYDHFTAHLGPPPRLVLFQNTRKSTDPASAVSDNGLRGSKWKEHDERFEVTLRDDFVEKEPDRLVFSIEKTPPHGME